MGNNDAIWSVSIPKSITHIGSEAFYHSSNISSFNIHSDNEIYKTIDGCIFTKDGNTIVRVPIKTKYFDIPSGVVCIGDDAFEDSEITSVVIPDTVISVGSVAFARTPLISIELPDSVETIGRQAFITNKSLLSVTIGSGITSIGAACFAGSDALQDVYFKGKTLQQVKAMTYYPWNISDKSVIRAELE